MDVGKNGRRRGKERKKRKRLFGAVMLALMVMLTVGVVAFAEGSGSYSLVVTKKFAADTPDEAKDLSYQFKITGEIIDGDGNKTPINKTISLPEDGDDGDPWKYTYYADAPFSATVTEITSGIQVTDSAGDAYNMGNSICETEALLRGPEPQKLQLKNNAKITISRPTEVNEGNGVRPLTTTTTFHIYNEPYPGHDTVSVPIDDHFELKPGAPAMEFSNLRAGIYTIEEMRAPNGYTIQVGERSADVLPDAKGEAVGAFYINGNPGRLTITAGGTQGDNATHYYTIDRVSKPYGDQGVFEPRTVCVGSGEEYIIDDLPKGSYTVTECTYAGMKGYTLTVPQSDGEESSKTSSAVSYGDDRTWKSFVLPSNADYINLIKFGQLYDNSKKPLGKTYSYKTFNYGVTDPDSGKISYRGFNKGPYESGMRTVIGPPDVDLGPDKKIYFAVTGASDQAVKYVGAILKVFTEKEETSEYTKEFGSSVTKTVDRRGWMLFNKAKDTSQGSENLTYHYTVTSSDKKPVAGCSVTDANGDLINGAMEIVDDSTVRLALKAGQSVKLNGLEKGTYSITETVDADRADGFKMKIVGCAVNVTTPNTSYPIKVQGGRDLTISKPACPAGSYGDGGRDYTFKVVDGNKNTVGDLITVKAGGAKTITLPQAGEYEVIPIDEADPFQMTYTDSSSINGIAQGKPSATITFTNVFTKGKGSYRYIHEYYLKTGEDSYQYEGSSQITHVRGLEIDDQNIYQALDIVEEPIFEKDGTVYTYTHFSEGYGKVDISDTESDKNREAEVADIRLDDLADVGGADADGWTKATRSDADVPTEEELDIDDPLDGESSGEDDLKDEEESDTDAPTDEEGSKADAPTDEEGSKADAPTDEEGSKADGSTDKEGPKADIPTDEEGFKADAPADEEGSKADAPTEADGTKADDLTDQDGSDGESHTDGDKSEIDSSTSDKELAIDDVMDGSSDMTDRDTDESSGADMQIYGTRIRDLSPVLCMTKEPVFVIGDAIYKSTHLARTMLHIESIAINGAADTKDPDAISLTNEDMIKAEDPTVESDPDEEELPNESKPDAGDPIDTSELVTAGPSNIETSDTEDLVDKGEPDAEDPTDEDGVDDEGLIDESEPDPEVSGDEREPDEERPTDENRSDADDPTDSGRPDDGSDIDGSTDKNKVGADILIDVASSSAARNTGRLLEDEAEAYAVRDLQQAVGDDGIVVVGSGVESDAGELYYETDPDMDFAVATEEGDDIIILRYFREIPEDKKGTYKVLHMYYYRDDQGDHLEGTSRYEIKNGQLGDHTYDASGIPLIETPPEEQVGGRYTYVHDKRPQYGVLVPDGSTPDSKITEDRKGGYIGGGYASRPDINWSSVRATEDGSQVIILRYYREVGGSYKIVHEYYVRERDAGVAEEEIPSEDRAEVGVDSGIGSEDDSEGVLEMGLSDGDQVQSAAYADTFNGTLYIDDDGYSYRYEGARSIESRRAKLGTDHIGEMADRKPDYDSRQYTYHSVVYGEVDQTERYDKIIDKQWATATEGGEQIIILRYYRDLSFSDGPDEPDDPDTPDETDPKPTPPGGGGGRHHRDPDPDPAPPSTTAPDPTPEQPAETMGENPGYPTELPDPNDPNSPDTITIWENGVPRTYVKVWDPETESWVYIPLDEIPLAWQDLPKTGDKSRNILWMTLFIGSVMGILWLIAVKRKQRS